MMTTICPVVAMSTLTLVSLIVAVVAIVGVVILKKRSSS
jgi:preprotein translocase subunit SecG